MALFSDIQALVENQTNGQGLKPGDVTSSFTGRPRFFSSTDDSVNEYQEEERDRKLIGSITKAGLTIGAAYTIKTMLENQRVQRTLRQHIELSYLDDSVRRLRQSSIKTFGDRLTLTNLAMEGARRAEELSPFSILRTFQMSHFLQPFATKESELTFSSSQIRAQQTYFNDIFQKHGNRKLLATDIANGLTVKEGKLFDHTGKAVVDNVRLVAAEWEGAGTVHDETSMINRVLRRYISQGDGYSAKGLREVFNLGQSDSLNRFTVIAGKTQSEIDKQWIKSAAGSAVSQGFLMVNEPAAFFQDMTETMFGKSKTIQSKPVQNFARLVTKALTINPGANTDTSVANLAKGYIKEGGRKSLIAGALFYAADNAAKVVGTEDSGYGKGIIEGLATTFVNAKLSYAENVSDSFSEYKEEQEYVAPKSTSLLNLLGLPLAGMMTGGIASYAERMFQTTSSQGGYLQAANAAKKELPLISSKVSTAVTGTAFEGLLGDMSRGRRYGTRGALLGAVLTLPFLPGALIGDSSKDIREEYVEGKEVAIRSNRYWFSGSNEYEGQGIKYFAKNWYQRIMNGAEDKVKYGDGETKEDMSPFYSPFEYLRNPYAFEEMHKDDMPYPVWGMDVSYGGWAGKIFEKTIGQVIKPDIINPEMYDMSEQPSALATIMSYGEQQVSAAYVTGDGSAYGKEDVTGVGIDYGSLSSIPVPTNETRNDMSLIEDGMMSRKRNLSYNPDGEAIQYTYRAATDFIGLKGWVSSLVGDELGILSDDYTNELARSGEATNVARSFMSYNAGGLFGGADVLRRIIPMSSDVMYNRSNPLHNKVSPYWLPSDDSQYYVDFSKGNYYANVERGYERLPGVGYEQANPELAGMSPDDYPDIYKYKILADVAYGSSEYYQAKDVMDNRYSLGDLTDEELNIYSTVYEQTQQRGQKKNFYEYKTDEDLEDVSAWGQVMNALWEPITHNAELPTENLTFFRPAGKLLHQRTAIEDYKKTQILGSDIAMWNRPIDHFIKPFVNESYGMFDGSFIPQDTIERRNVDSYFDALEYHKQMKIYRESMASGNTSAAEFAREQSQRTIYGALASGLDNDQEVIRAYSGLTENEKPYFSSFVNAKESDRAQISSMLDQNLSSMYNMLWERKDVAESGGDIQAYSEMEENELIARNASSYGMYQHSEDAKIGMTFREYLYDQQATQRIEDATGLPDESFVGWDPRIDLDDVKLRTLMVGKEDIRRYGYWEADEQKLQRQLAVLEETQVTQMVSSIKKSDSEKRFNYGIELKDRLSRNGIEATKIHLSNVGYGDFDMNIID